MDVERVQKILYYESHHLLKDAQNYHVTVHCSVIFYVRSAITTMNVPVLVAGLYMLYSSLSMSELVTIKSCTIHEIKEFCG